MSHLRFIHAADIHLGRPFSGLDRTSPDLATLFRKAAWEAWKRIVTTAVERKVDFVVLAGDVFDASNPSIRARVAFREGIDCLHQARIPVFMALGNHDPLTTFPDALSGLPGLHVFGKDPEGLFLEGAEAAEGVKIYGASFERSAVRQNLAAKFSRDPGVQIAVAVLHANVSGTQGHEDYAPCNLNDLKGGGMDVWCLGHVHTPGILSSDPLVLYSGTAQGARIQESGRRGTYLVTLDERCRASTEFLALAPVWWLTVDVDATHLNTLEDFLRATQESVSELAQDEESPDALVARINITGEADLDWASLMSDDDTVELLMERLSILPVPVFLESLNVAAGSRTRLEDLKTDQGLVGEFLRACMAAAGDPHQMGEVSEEVIRELLSHVSYSYLAEELRAHGSSPHVWSQLLEEAAAAGARMFLEDGAGPGPRQITMSTNR